VVVSNEQIFDILSRIRASDAKSRELFADEITDIYQTITKTQAEMIAKGLVAVCLMERDYSCQESQLNALCVLDAWHLIDKSIFQPLHVLNDDGIGDHLKSYLEDILKERLECTVGPPFIPQHYFP
jgi:hypothetical protein